MANFIPDTIILNTSAMVWAFKDKLMRLSMNQLECEEFIDHVMCSLMYEEIAFSQLTECVKTITNEYRGCFPPDELAIFGNILFELGTEMFQYFKQIGAYLPETKTLPYHFDKMLPGGDIVMKFDYSDGDEFLWS